MSACEALRAGAGEEWAGLARHPFVREMVDGTLPAEKFRFYIEQNLLYLPEFARTIALAAARADTLEDMGTLVGLTAEVLEIEIPANRALLEEISRLAPEPQQAGEPAPANLAYTSFLIRTAYERGATEVMAAILPCAWSYGEIALLAGTPADHPVYAGWVSFFTGDEYRAALADLRARFERMARGRDIGALQPYFTASVRLERGFWDMAYDHAARTASAVQTRPA